MKRIKKVFSSSSQVFHLWANQSQDGARQGGRLTRAFFDGSSAYSYGFHYKVGEIVTYNGIKLGIVNNAGYSSTTGKHIYEAYGALADLMPRMYSKVFFTSGTTHKPTVRDALVEQQSDIIDSIMNTFNQIKFGAYSPSPAKEYANDQFSGIPEFNDLCKLLGHPELMLTVPQDFKDVVQEYIQHRMNRAIELRSPEAEAKREAARVRKQALEAVKNAASVEAWKAGGPTNNYIRTMRPMAIRVQGNTVYTSAGAQVPLMAALTLLKAIEKGKAEAGMPVGSFTFNGVEKDGTVRLGCHTFNIQDAKIALLTKP